MDLDALAKRFNGSSDAPPPVAGGPDLDALARRMNGSVSTGEDVARSALFAVPKAAIGMAGLPGDISSLARSIKAKALQYLPDWVGQADAITSAPSNAFAAMLPHSGQLRGAAEKVTGPFYEPVTRAGKATDTALQAAATMGRGLVTSPLKALGMVGSITAGTEGAGMMTDDNPWTRAAGGILTGGTHALVDAARGRPGVIVRDAVGELAGPGPQREVAPFNRSQPYGASPFGMGQLDEARAMEQAGQRYGVPLLGTESLDRGHQLASAVLASPSGNAIVEPFLRARAGAVKGATDENLLALTGPRRTPNENASRAAKAATDVIGKAESDRTAATAPLYAAAADETLPASALKPVGDDLVSRLLKSSIGGPQEAAYGNWHGRVFPTEAPPVMPAAPMEPPKAPRTPWQVPAVNPEADDIITAIRKLGGLNPADEAIGSLAKANPFSPHPVFGPVWRNPEARGPTGTRAGHSLDRMAELLDQYGYVNRNDPGAIMDKIADSGMGQQHFSNAFDHGAAQAAEDPLHRLPEALDRLVGELGARRMPRPPAPQPLGPGAALPETNVGRLNEIYRDARMTADVPTIGASNEQKFAAYPAQQVQRTLGDVLSQGSPNWRAAEQRYAKLSQDVVDPLKAGPVGVVAGKRGVDPAAPSDVGRVVSSIAAPSQRAGDIRELYTNLNGVDRQAFPGIVQTHIESELNTAMKAPLSGFNGNAGAKVNQALRGTPAQQESFDEMMRGVADAHGLPQDQVVQGANRFLDVLERTGRTPGVGSQTQPRSAINAEMGRTVMTDVGHSISSRPLAPLMDRISQRITRGRWDDLARALTAPDSVDQLARMAKMEPSGLTAAYTAAALLGVDKAAAAP